MRSRTFRDFYCISISSLLILSAYPLTNGMRMAILFLQNGVLEPDEYAKYVVPYTAMCVSVLLFSILLPFFFRLRRFAFAAGLSLSNAVFLFTERFFEQMKIRTVGMVAIDPATFKQSPPPDAVLSADAWQASLCIASPLTKETALPILVQEQYRYVPSNTTYQFHYYFLAMLLIAMVTGLLFGVGRIIQLGKFEKEKQYTLSFIAVTSLLSLCVFANTTAFFRKTDTIQTPLASILTCLFFLVLGVSVGIYIGSFLIHKKNILALYFPTLFSALTVLLFYFGEALMMKGGLYRFGKGFFFQGMPVIILAPIDVLVVMSSALLTYLVLFIVSRNIWNPNRKTACLWAVLYTFTTIYGSVLAA